MNQHLPKIIKEIYHNCSFQISNYKIEPESKEYHACQFDLNGKHVIFRNAKITPKKAGQFVTFWKRNQKGIIEPFNQKDRIDFYTINVSSDNQSGLFVFPKSILIKNGIISTEEREGKRGFRVYPKWDVAMNKQAKRTQNWQLKYFVEINALMDYKILKELYE